MTEQSMRLSRRHFLEASVAAGGGLLIGFHLPFGGRFADAAPTEVAVNAWLRIAPDDTVTIIVPSAEMGQGIYTSLPMLVAEELEVDWRKVRAETAPAAPAYANPMLFGLQATGGSTSIRAFFEPLRKVGAQTREMLRQAAAERWGAPIAECEAREGQITHRPSGRALRYGELAEAAAKGTPSAEVALKEPTAWTLLGKATPRLDTPAKVDGSAVFGIDVKLPDMLIGTVAACPVFGGKLKAVDEKPALAVKGVHKVVPLESAVVVLGDGYWPAKQGLAALSPQWDFGANAGASSEAILADFKAQLDSPGAVAGAAGDTAAALAAAAQRLEAVYQVPYLAHATMEPMNATAHVTADGIEIWAPTQAQGPTQQTFAKMFNLKPEQVRVHTTFLGGGFGRKFELDFLTYAVLASKAAGRPVKVVWSREEDIQHDFYRPAAVVRFRAGFDADGRPQAWEAKIVAPSIMTRAFPDFVKDGVDPTSVEGIADTPYGVPNRRFEYVMRHEAVPVGFWRSVGNSQNAFFAESFVDEMAHAAKQDSVAFRLALLADKPRHRAVLEKAAQAAGWGTAAPAGRFRGVAIHQSFGSIVAEVAEISLDGGKSLRVHKVTCAVDCGRAMNPSTVVAQMESGIVFGLTAAFYGEVTLKDGRIDQANFDSYPMLKLAQTPAIEVHIVESGAELGGIGEPGTPPIAPAVANALFAATGKRIRSLPLVKNGIEPA